MQRINEWIGVHHDPDRRNTSAPPPSSDVRHVRSDWGGITDLDLWLALYKTNTTRSGRSAKIGNWHGPDEALKTLREAICHPADAAVPTSAPTAEPEKYLIGADLPTRATWDSAAKGYVPRAGCVTDFNSDLFPEGLRKEYAPGSQHGEELLPLVLKQREMTTEDRTALDVIFQGYLDAGAIVEWTEDKGLPTAVTPVSVVWQGTPEKRKPRVILDYRYVNGAIPKVQLLLPSVIDIGRELRKDDLIAKEDLKTGYHQIRLRVADYHLCTTIWRGKLYAFTCMTFGLRDAPGEFQRRTEYAATYIKQKLNLRICEVYLDDFIQVCSREQYEAVVEMLGRFGFVMGRKKCEPPEKRREVLGLILDSGLMKIIAPQDKIDIVAALLRRYKSRERTTAHELSKILGILVHIEPAVPRLLLLTRPLYDDLKSSLVRRRHLGKDDELVIERHGLLDEGLRGDKWRRARIDKTKEGRQATLKIVNHIRIRNGQILTKAADNIVVRSDASARGLGGRIFFLNEQGEVVRIQPVAADLPPDMIGTPSMAREAFAFAYVCAQIHPRLLKGKQIAGVVDNKGLTKRFWIGSRNPLVNRCLMDLDKFLDKRGAALHRMVWTRRENITVEDGLSRKKEYVDEVVRTNRGWFAKWWAKQTLRPNADAFASKYDFVLTRYAAIDGTGFALDGASYRWQKEEVPWFFPPLTMIQRAIQNWLRSESQASYWCLPRVGWGAWHAIFARPDVIATWTADRPLTHGGRGKWKFAIVLVRKRAHEKTK